MVTVTINRMSLPNGIAFRRAALAACTSVTDGQTTQDSIRRSSRNSRIMDAAHYSY